MRFVKKNQYTIYSHIAFFTSLFSLLCLIVMNRLGSPQQDRSSVCHGFNTETLKFTVTFTHKAFYRYMLNSLEKQMCVHIKRGTSFMNHLAKLLIILPPEAKGKHQYICNNELFRWVDHFVFLVVFLHIKQGFPLVHSLLFSFWTTPQTVPPPNPPSPPPPHTHIYFHKCKVREH